jgi:hypothetical protein
MDLDEYFTIGPADPFHRNPVFTDRRAYLDLFAGRVEDHFSRRFPVEDFTNFRRPARNLLVLHGDGGIGKTTLLDRLCDEFRGLESHALPERRAAVVIDFADTVNHNFETVLLRLRSALAQLATQWLCFDSALASYWERGHPGVPLGAFINRTGMLDSDQRRMFADQVTGLLDTLAGGTGLVSVGITAIGSLTRELRNTAALRKAKDEFPPLRVILDEPQPEKMLSYLPILLGWDLERVNRRHGAAAVCLFDTFEAVQSLTPELGFLEDLLSRTVFLLPNVLFVVAGRRPLRWHDPVRALGLRYGGVDRWPGLAGREGSDQYPLAGFTEADADSYLQTRLTDEHGRAAIGPEIRQRMIAGSSGSPLYLDLSVGLFRNAAATGHPVDPDQFGTPMPELVLRIMRDLSGIERDLLRAASLLEAFDADVLAATLPEVRRRDVERFLGMSFVHQHDDTWPRYRLHESLRRSVLECDHAMSDGWVDDERAGRLGRALRRVADVGLAVWATTSDDPADGADQVEAEADLAERVEAAEQSRRAVTALLLSLHAGLWHELAPPRLEQLAYTVSQLGHWQVLAALPQAESAPAPLRRLVEVARLAGDGATDAGTRYAAALAVAEGGTDHACDLYVQYELAQLSQVTGDREACDRHFTALAGASAPLSDAAAWGRAGVAIQQSRLADALRYAGRARAHPLDRTRTQDLMGHIYLQGGDFERAAGLFRATLDDARAGSAPLWAARALRHSALALMWVDPARARDLLPEARDLNAAMADAVGLAQCDLAGSVVAAGEGDFDRARGLLAQARERVRAMGTFEPVDLVEALICAVLDERDAALAAARRLVDDVRAGGPGIPAWAAIATLWVDRPDLFDFAEIGWYDAVDDARRRWMQPYEQMRALR